MNKNRRNETLQFIACITDLGFKYIDKTDTYKLNRIEINIRLSFISIVRKAPFIWIDITQYPAALKLINQLLNKEI